MSWFNNNEKKYFKGLAGLAILDTKLPAKDVYKWINSKKTEVKTYLVGATAPINFNSGDIGVMKFGITDGPNKEFYYISFDDDSDFLIRGLDNEPSVIVFTNEKIAIQFIKFLQEKVVELDDYLFSKRYRLELKINKKITSKHAKIKLEIEK